MKPSPLLSIVKADVLLALAIFNSHCVPITTSVNVRKLTAITKNVELKDALADASSKHQWSHLDWVDYFVVKKLQMSALWSRCHWYACMQKVLHVTKSQHTSHSVIRVRVVTHSAWGSSNCKSPTPQAVTVVCFNELTHNLLIKQIQELLCPHHLERHWTRAQSA